MDYFITHWTIAQITFAYVYCFIFLFSVVKVQLVHVVFARDNDDIVIFDVVHDPRRVEELRRGGRIEMTPCV